MRIPLRRIYLVFSFCLIVAVCIWLMDCGGDGGSSVGSAPSIEITTCPGEGMEQGAPCIFEWTAGDDAGSVSGYYYDIDDETPETWTQATCCSLLAVPAGAHMFYVQAEANSGQRSEVASCSFSVLEPGAGCDVSPDSLDFGTVDVGASADLTFTVTNSGETVFSGTVSETCDDYAIVGDASYSLSPGGTKTVTVRFSPGSCGASSCTIETGASACSDVECTGTGGGTGCELSPSSLDFGTVNVGSTSDGTFVLKNTGCTTLSGEMEEACEHYSLVSGGGVYSVEPGDSVVVTVRFEPGSSGTHTCTVETGLVGTGCSGVDCSGEGHELVVGCDVSPTVLSFGTVDVGASSDLSFTVTNNGETLLAGTLSMTCDDYVLVEDGWYALGPGQSKTFTVRFSPGSCGASSCTIHMDDSACSDVECTGTGGGTGCELSPASLDFGTVDVGSTSDGTFVLKNTGCTTLSGEVVETCEDYSLVSGGGVYSVEPGDSVVVTVRFGPSSSGTHTCTVETGLVGTGCSGVDCSGEGHELVVGCDVSPTVLSFGTVDVGASADLTFTVTNGGETVLSGTVSETCDDYAIVGDASYSLAPGGANTFTVRFSPGSCGASSCTIDTDESACSDVECTGTGGGTGCELSPSSLDFGTVNVGSTSDGTFVLKNTGCTTLSGEMEEACEAYSLVSGGGVYSVEPGDSVVVTVRFEPGSSGTHTCTVETGLVGTGCSGVDCSGEGHELAAGCDVSPTVLGFGTVDVGASADLTFTVTNSGETVLSGTVSETCADYAIVGDASYSLAPGGARTFTVRFSPGSCGASSCTIDTDESACSDVACTGTGGGTSCEVSPTSLSFGTVDKGGSSDKTFTITNDGCMTFSGTVSETSGDYSIVGSASYSLGPGASKTVTVRFSPGSCGASNCTIETGSTACSDVACTGTGGGTSCEVSPTSLSFGTVDKGGSSDKTFTITNDGCTTLGGTVSETSGDYSIVGSASYSLGPGASKTVTVRFSPGSCGASNCTIETGSTACSDVACTGTGGGASCSVVPTTVDFGTVDVGGGVWQSFMIKNDGCTTLNGEVSETCDDYYIDGTAAYSIAPGDSQWFTVVFVPSTCGPNNCIIETGNSVCSDVSITGVGGGAHCTLEPTQLSFGTVDVGSYSDETFTITSDGCTTLSGTVSEMSSDYSIVGDASYSLAPGASKAFTVRFSPGSCGPSNCTIDTGSPDCSGVGCTGTGGGASCDVSATELSFGTVAVGSHSDETFTITNDGCTTLSGTVSLIDGAYYSIVEAPSYSIAAGASRTFTVRFSPIYCGLTTCVINTGNSACSDILCTAVGGPGPCQVEPTSVWFGSVACGSYTDRTITYTNQGCSDAVFNASSNVAPTFSIVSGAGPVTVGVGMPHEVVVRYVPTRCGTFGGYISGGFGDAECSLVYIYGTGTGDCWEAGPASIDFGTVPMGGFADGGFTIRNFSCDALTVNLPEACGDYNVISGAGTRTIPAHDSLGVTIRFWPTDCGTKSCTINLGVGTLPEISCTGEASPSEDCSISPLSLNFGSRPVGSFTDLTFTITNSGSVDLSGVVSKNCSQGDFSIESGGGAYVLAPGAHRDVTVRLSVTTTGKKSCVIETGNGLCCDVHCTGQGF